MELYLILTIFNLLWYIVWILYIFYKYTAVINVIFSFSKSVITASKWVCKKCYSFLKNKNSRRADDLEMQRMNLSGNTNEKLYSKTTSYIKNIFNRFRHTGETNLYTNSNFYSQENFLHSNYIKNYTNLNENYESSFCSSYDSEYESNYNSEDSLL